MAVMLPPELSKFLNMIGFEWPEGNEDKVFDWGNRWMTYSNEITRAHTTATDAHDQVVRESFGDSIEAFTNAFKKAEGPDDVGKNLAVAATITGGCLFVVGAAIVVLKIVFVVNLAIFAFQVAAAIAAAIPTFGASMSWIPLAQIIAQRALQYGISLAIETVLGGA